MTADNPQFNTGAKIPRRLFLTGAGLAGASYLLNQALRLPENDSGTSSKSSLTQSETDLGVWSNSIDEVTNQMGKVESDVFFSPNAESNFLGVDYYRIINRKQPSILIPNADVVLASPIEMNGHSVERRGEVVAREIWDTVGDVFNHPENYPNTKRRKLCGSGIPGQGIVDAVFYAIETVNGGGKTRIYSVLVGSRSSDGAIVHITSINHRKNMDSYERFMHSKGFSSANCGKSGFSNNLLNPRNIFTPSAA